MKIWSASTLYFKLNIYAVSREKYCKAGSLRGKNLRRIASRSRLRWRIMLPQGIFSTPTYRDDIAVGTVRQPQMERCGEVHCTSYCKNC